MFGIKTFTAGMLLGVGGAMFISHYHVVHTNEGVVVVPRTQRPPLRSSYVDVRNWSAAMWVNHPEVTQALVADGRTNLIGEQLHDNLLDELVPEELLPAPSMPTVSSRSVARAKPVQPIGQEAEIQPAPRKRFAAPKVPDNWSVTQSTDDAKGALDQVLAPIVDEDEPLDEGVLTEELPVDDAPETSRPVRAVDSLRQRITESMDPRKYEAPVDLSAEALEDRGRDLIRQMIPATRESTGSATPLRDLSRDWLSAPSPGSNSPAKTSNTLHESRLDEVGIK